MKTEEEYCSHWTVGLPILELIAHEMLIVFQQINLQELWNLILKECKNDNTKIAEIMFKELVILIRAEISGNEKIETQEVLDYYCNGYSKDLSMEEMQEKVATMFAIAFLDIIALAYFQYRTQYQKNKLLGLVYGNMSGGIATPSDTISVIIFLEDYSQGYDGVIGRIKEVNNQGRRNVCPFYRSKMRQSWVDGVYGIAEKIDFSQSSSVLEAPDVSK